MSSLLVFTSWSNPVHCTLEESAIFDPPSNETCGEYLASYMEGMGVGANLLNPEATVDCRVCKYTEGGDYLKTLNIKEKSYGWRNAGIIVVFVVGIYGLVYLMMKLRTKATKKAES
jgi:ABC-type multidrug transport system permease subunit